MGFFFSPFRWLWIIFGIVVLSIFAVIVASTIYFGLSLGHAVLFTPHVFSFPFFGFGFGFLGILVLALFLGLIFRPFPVEERILLRALGTLRLRLGDGFPATEIRPR